MTTFHISPNTGAISRCRAEKEPCPFGPEVHFEGLVAAKEGFEKFMQGRTLVSHSKTPEAPAQGKGTTTKKAKKPTPLVPPTTLFDEEGSLEYHAALTTAKRFDAQVEEAIKTKRDIFDQGGEEATWSPEYFKLIHKQKEAYFRRLKAQQELLEVMSEEQRKAYDADLAQKAAAKEERSRKWYESRGLVKGKDKGAAPDRHPEITEKNELPARETIRVYSGWTDGQIMGAVEQHMAAGLTRTEAYRKVWAEVPQRTDKPFVYIDLETASDNSDDRVDQGRYSHIIEVGYQKVWADGRVEEGSFLYDVPQSFKEAGQGTGASYIHHITPEMVEGKPVFMEDAAAQHHMIEVLKDSVLVAHNAPFEASQFRYNLFGYRQLVGSGSTEIMDTQKVCKFYIPETPTNSNKDFVETTGGVYGDDAHRALYDAAATRGALERHRATLAS